MQINLISAATSQLEASSDNILNRLDIGDILKAKVLDTKSGEATLRLYDGSLLKAATTDEFSAREGQNVTLAVSARSEGTIYLEIVKNTDATAVNSELLKKSLDALQVKVDNKNVQLASELTMAGIPLDKKIMDKARELMNSFKEIDAPKAVSIAAKGLGLGTDGLEQLVKLLVGNLKLGEQLSALKELVAGISEAVIGHSSEFQNSIDFPTDVFADKLFLDDANSEALQMTGTAQKGTGLTGMAKTGLAQVLSASQEKASGQASAGLANTAQSTKITVNASAVATNVVTSTQEAVQNLRGTTAASVNAAAHTPGASQTGMAQASSAAQAPTSTQASASLANGVAYTHTATAEQASTGTVNEAAVIKTRIQTQVDSSAQGSEAVKAYPEGSTIKQQISNISDNKQLIDNKDNYAGLNNDISTNGISAKAGKEVNTQVTFGTHASNTEASLISMDTEVLKQADNINFTRANCNAINDTHGASHREIIGDELQQLFIDTDSPELPQKINIREIENKIEEKLGNIKVLIRSSYLSAAEGRSINQAAGSVAESVRVLSHLNNNSMIYYQLPLNMHGYNTTAELYVMKRSKRQRSIDPNNNVMFIALDTQSMGRVETLLDVKDKSICINIRTENERINSFLKENVKELYNGLNACGYKLASVKYSLISAPSDPIEQERLMKNTLSYEHGKVDLRI